MSVAKAHKSFLIFFLSILTLFSCKKEADESLGIRLKSKSEISKERIDFSKKLYFNAFTIKEGLPSPHIWSIFQDHLGFMWLATSEGVVRYDGYQFFLYQDNLKTGVKLKRASGFFEDSDGTLWIINGAGYLNKFNRDLDRFEYIKTPLENGWSEQSTHTILEDSLKNLWIGAYGGLQYYDKLKDTITVYPLSRIRDESWLHEEKLRFGKMYADNIGNIWIGTRKFGLVKFNLKTKKYHCFRFDKEYNKKILSDWITDIEALSDGTLLISEWDVGLIHFDPKSEKIIEIIKTDHWLKSKEKPNIRDIQHEDDHTFSLATDKHGLLIFDLKQKQISNQFSTEKNSENGLTHNQIKCLFKDNQGILWLGTNSLQNVSNKFYRFSELQNDLTKNTSLKSDLVFSLSPTQDHKILASTDKGLSIFDEKTGVFNNSLKPEREPTFGALEDKNFTYWVGYKDRLEHIDPVSKKIIKKYPANLLLDKEDNYLKRILKLMEDSQGNIWAINHWGRLNLIRNKGTSVVQIKELIQDPFTKKFINVTAVLDDPTYQRILVATDHGLYTINYQTKLVKKIDLKSNGLSLSNESIFSISYGQKGLTWLLIAGKPYLMALNDFSLQPLNLPNDFQNLSARWLIEQPKGVLWLSTYKGLIYHKTSSRFTQLYKTENLGENTLDEPSPLTTSNGKIYFSGFRGITVVEPEKLKNKDNTSKIIIESIKIPVKKDRVLDTTIMVYQKPEYSLAYFQNKFTIKYVGLKYHNSQEQKYAYRLQGYDKEWVEAADKQEVTYTNLSPKTYIFEVKTEDKIAKIKLIIKPPFWQTWWAYLIYLVAVSGLIYAYLRWRINVRLQKIKDLEKTRIGISSNLHDDVGTILSGLAMQSQMLALTAQPDQKHMLLEISNMSHDAMERMRDTVWAIDSRKDKYENLLDKMREFAEKNFHLKNIKHNFLAELNEPDRFIEPEKRQNIYLIFKEAVTNICKHSDANFVQINFNQEKDNFSLEIKDNGNSKKETKSEGLGLNNIKMRAKSQGFKLLISNKNGYRILLEN